MNGCRRIIDSASGAKKSEAKAFETLRSSPTLTALGLWSLATLSARPVQAPARQNKLIIEGVQVSIYADLLAIGERAGVGLIGAAVLRMTQSDTDSDIAVQRRREIGTYVATLARAHTEANLAGNRTTTNRFCMSIDVQHGEVFVAPNSSTRRMNDLTNACRFIAAIWPTA